tara:strand:- start:83 stop:283 length:201 start_codon:yes stop_codon:yes gene_type:complete
LVDDRRGMPKGHQASNRGQPVSGPKPTDQLPKRWRSYLLLPNGTRSTAARQEKGGGQSGADDDQGE